MARTEQTQEYTRVHARNHAISESARRVAEFGKTMSAIDKAMGALDPHQPGAKLDAGKPRPSLILSGMPRALLEVAQVATFGAAKYSENGWLQVENGVARYTDALDRHRLLEQVDGPLDPESGLKHAAHLAWNALARLELMLREAEDNAQHHGAHP